MNTTVTAPADDPTSQYANASHFYYTNAGTNPRQCDGWADYYIPTSDGNYTSLFNYPIGDWTWTAPEVTNYDFVGWYTIGRSYHASSGDSYQVPNLKSDFTMCVSKERTITWQLLEDALNYWGYLYYFQKLADYRYRSESRSYNFLRLVYKLKTKTITFMANGGSGAMPLQQIPVTGGQLNANQFTRTNHVFLGWALSASGSVVYADGATIVPTQDLTLYAKWSSLERVVTFHPNGGEASQYFKRVVQGQTYGTLPTCTYEGRTFLGWFTSLSGGT